MEYCITEKEGVNTQISTTLSIIIQSIISYLLSELVSAFLTFLDGFLGAFGKLFICKRDSNSYSSTWIWIQTDPVYDIRKKKKSKLKDLKPAFKINLSIG